MPETGKPLQLSGDQTTLRAVFMRGGTSKAIFFHRKDLPPVSSPHDNETWNEIFRKALGSPDPYGRQLDGLGGGQSSLSKIAIVAPSTRSDADVDFTFAQVGIDDTSVSYRGNCGNISSAVGPFAVDEGLVAPDGASATVRIYNTNTGKLIVATFPVVDGKARVSGDYELQGVAGSGAAIRLAFVEPGGAATGALLPTGNPIEALTLDDGRTLDVSLVDAANPVVFLSAGDLGLTATESPADLRANKGAMADFEMVRIAAAVRMGIVRTASDAREKVRNLPLVAVLGNQDAAQAAGADVAVRMISAGLPHGATPLTGALCLAVAAQIPGTLVHTVSGPGAAPDRLRIGHASGVMDLAAVVEQAGGVSFAREAVVFRTARRLMDGQVHVHRD